MQPIIFMDLDGVLVDLKKGLSEKINKNLQNATPKEFTTAFYDFINSLSYYETVEFWADLPATEDCLQIWNTVKFYKPLILTSVSGVLPAVFGKQMWCYRHLDLPSSRVFCSKNSKEKKFYASKKSLLVDDFIDNINEFREAGGTAIHHTDTASTISDIQQFIEKHWLYF